MHTHRQTYPHRYIQRQTDTHRHSHRRTYSTQIHIQTHSLMQIHTHKDIHTHADIHIHTHTDDTPRPTFIQTHINTCTYYSHGTLFAAPSHQKGKILKMGKSSKRIISLFLA